MSRSFSESQVPWPPPRYYGNNENIPPAATSNQQFCPANLSPLPHPLSQTDGPSRTTPQMHVVPYPAAHHYTVVYADGTKWISVDAKSSVEELARRLGVTHNLLHFTEREQETITPQKQKWYDMKGETQWTKVPETDDEAFKLAAHVMFGDSGGHGYGGLTEKVVKIVDEDETFSLSWELVKRVKGRRVSKFLQSKDVGTGLIPITGPKQSVELGSKLIEGAFGVF